MTCLDDDNLMTLTHSPIVGSEVRTPDNKVIGEISGVVLNTFTGDTPFALICLYAKSQHLKNRHIAISWDYFEDATSREQEFVLNVKRIEWKDMAYFNSEYQLSQSEPLPAVASQQIWAGHYVSYSNQ